MTSPLLPLATTLVRAWTRLYTHGLPPAERSARRAEIDSDLWEFEHDPEAARGGRAAAEVLARLLIGVPDDLLWRIDAAADAHAVPARALATAAVMTGPRRVSSFGLAATIHIVVMSVAVWGASLGPAASTMTAGAASGPVSTGRRLPPLASVLNQLVRRPRHTASTAMKAPGHTPATPQTASVPGPVRAAAAALSPRLGTPSRFAARSLSPASAPPAANVTASASRTTAGFGAVRAAAAVVAAPVVSIAPAGVATTSGQSAQTAPPVPASDKLAAKLLESRYSLSVRNGQLAGSGAQLLQSAIAQSRFVLLGEDHGFAQTFELGTAVCSAGPERFHAMAIEEGPLAAASLEGWTRRADGLAQLAAFENTFPQSVGSSPEEFEMLQQCARAAQGDFHLWGLNQEGLGAGGLILSRILESRLGESARPAMRQLFEKNEDAYRKALQSGRIADLFMLSADDQELAGGAAVLERDGSPAARALFASLVESHEINRTSAVDYDNARRRERLMKTRFAAEYARASKAAAASPRVFLKLGAYHIYRGANPVRGAGVGNYVAEFAEGQGARSLHIRLMPVKGSQPIYPRVGQPAQLRPFNYEDDPRSRYLQPVLTNRLPSDWTLFDLRPLRRDFNTLGSTNPELATLVFGIDLLVLVPEGTPSVKIP